MSVTRDVRGKAVVDEIMDEIFGPMPRPKPKVVVEDAEPVRDADVHVSRADTNAGKGVDRVVEVRRADWVTVNIKAWEEQKRWEEEDRRHRMSLDPCRLGIWGPVDWEDD